MGRRIPQTELLFPELSTGPENPWVTTSARRVEDSWKNNPTTLELCAGGGGQAIGLEHAGFEHIGLVEIDKNACATLRLNRPGWNVIEEDLNTFDGSSFRGVDVISGGLPCPPFSVAGKQLGKKDERNLFPSMIRLVDQIQPRAVMIENVRGFLDAIFDDYRGYVKKELAKLGYEPGWKLMNASDFGVPQLRPRVVFVAVRKDLSEHFSWPQLSEIPPKSVGEILFDLMAANGWTGAKAWAKQASEIAPTIVGGSHKHGGPDLGPTRARKAWATLGVDGLGLANEAPGPEFPINGMPRLTVRMVARVQGFPDEWQFAGGKTQSYRQVGNAFPPPFARAVAERVRACLAASRSLRIAG
ncbi:MAG TPA: DNA cytosine methyltransferase [Bryobacteraceae bacterium]|jgi:DNA (cytosine-5)-methyltransferase 1|nr:DNA cytosine methyltransferase [Bryobacteraceae bacterium]